MGLTRDRAVNAATRAKALFDELEAEHAEGTPTGDKIRRLHQIGNRAAHWLADHFEEDVTVFSGGTPKPARAPADEDDEG